MGGVLSPPVRQLGLLLPWYRLAPPPWLPPPLLPPMPRSVPTPQPPPPPRQPRRHTPGTLPQNAVPPPPPPVPAAAPGPALQSPFPPSALASPDFPEIPEEGRSLGCRRCCSCLRVEVNVPNGVATTAAARSALSSSPPSVMMMVLLLGWVGSKGCLGRADCPEASPTPMLRERPPPQEP